MCGLTRVDEALGCVACVAAALGCVFYPESARNVSDQQAKAICDAVPNDIKIIGVFVDETFSYIMQKVKACGLKGVQLHGRESPELTYRLLKENLLVIKALFVEGRPPVEDISNYEASAYLVECGQGKLPGGNALTWNWEKAKNIGEKYPFILAGGLAPHNIFDAASAAVPDAVDVSSGVELGPGRKDLEKVKAFLNAVALCRMEKKLRKIF